MSISTSLPPQSQIVYPEDDGEPMAENTVQFRWIVTIKEGLEKVFRDRPDVFVAGDLLWYPVEGQPETRQAPDAMVVFGRPKGDRGSYMQWVEGGIAPQVVFEILSPGNRYRYKQSIKKFDFYQRHGVEEFYVYNPESFELDGWKRSAENLEEILEMNGWVSPRLGVRFDRSQGELILIDPEGQRFLTYAELALERDAIARELATAKEHAERLAAQLRSLGVEPHS
ncbi:MAG: Uma2 family endonuclease [Isosphaeraceae bacterium]|jgi:Uma2 family endonuclease